MKTLLHVTRVAALGAYEVEVAFDDGAVKRVDLSGELWGEAFEPLNDPAFFRQVRLNPETGTVEWPNGADFAPEFLHAHGRDISSD